MRMYINRIEIFGYGKWSNVRMDFHQQLQIFQGENESGKSTLRSFIQHVLFGFPKKVAGKYPYEPHHGGVMGGRIWLDETDEGSLVIERYIKNGKLCFRCETTSEKSLSEERWKQLLFQMDEKQYVQVFGFNKEQLDQFHFSSMEEMDQFLYSVSLTGSEEWMKLSTSLQKQAESIFTPKAVKRMMNQQLQQLDLQMIKIEELAQNNEIYEEMIQKSENIKKEIQNHSQKIQKNQEDDRVFQLLYSHWSSYERWKELRNKIHMNQKDTWDSEWKYELERNQLDFEWNEQQLHELQQKYHLWKQRQQSEQLLKEDARWSSLLNLFLMEDEIEEKILLRKNLKIELDELKQTIEKEEELWNVYHQNLPLKMTDRDIERLKEMLHQEKSLTFKELELESQMNRLKQEAEKLNNHSNRKHSTQNRFNASGLLMISGLVTILISLMLLSNPLLKGFGMIIGLLIGCSSLLYGKNFIHEKQMENYFSKKLEEIQEELDRYTLQSKQNQEEVEKIKKEFSHWKKEFGYADSKISVEQLCQGDVLKSLRYFVQQSQTKEEKLQQIESEINQLQTNWRWVFEVRKETIPNTIEMEWKILKKMIQEVQNSYQKELLQMNEGLKLQEQIQQLYCDKQLLEIQKTTLFKMANVQTAEEFYEKEAVFERNRLLIQEYHQLQQQLKPYLEKLEEIKSEEDLECKIEVIQQSLFTLLQKNQFLLEEQAKLGQQIHYLVTDGTYHEQLIQFELWKTEVEEQLVDWASHLYASKWILESLQKQLPSQTNEVIQVASEYLNRLTQGRYQTIQMKNMKIAVQNQDEKWFLASELSRGTLDQLLISIRLAFIRNLSSKISLPILIDDGFVNFDSVRKKIMLQLIKELSHKVQVVYFSLDEEPFMIAETPASLIRLLR
ncbi:AAA family ATPase [uncultured Granulicatella sp.]|uniref:ATP-binding protein n=1 Tax=uncultured Granulicatella sp. TaxID=316089 RepID=UPI0028D5E5E3|nr:AAA family ATPase [uncultured Granulicatella sp.]